MHFTSFFLLAALLAQSALGHYVFDTVIAGSTQSTAAVRRPISNSPVEDLSSNNMRCNVNPTAATETVSVAAGSTIGFKLEAAQPQGVGHPGPAAIYLGKAPSTATSWDGSGPNWFKIAEWGAKFNPFGFVASGATQFTTTIPSNVPAGEYLVRIEHIGLHVAGSPQFYISCAQIKITGGGSANPSKVSIPGYLSKSDPSLTVNIYYPEPTSYTVPGPRPFRG